MNRERLARLFRERAQLDLQIADALLEDDAPKRPRQKPRPELRVVSPEALNTVRDKLRRQGIS
jgi:hypothetical protein